MERTPHFLDEYVKELEESGELEKYASRGKLGELWYNEHGDCVMFLSANEAVVADRIDEYLTLHRSAVDNRVIGFQIKGIQALMREFDYGQSGMSAELQFDEVKTIKLLLISFYKCEFNKRRLEGYAEAMKKMSELVPNNC